MRRATEGALFLRDRRQNKLVWALIDSGSSRNLLSEETYQSLAARPRMRSPGRVQILTGNETPVELLGFVTLIVHVTGIDLYHEFGVIRDFPLRAVIGFAWAVCLDGPIPVGQRRTAGNTRAEKARS